MDRSQFVTLLENIGCVLIGKQREIEMALACLLGGGHLLLEDIPGTGKTTLSLCLAKGLGLDFRRIQLTNDVMPSDIIGVMIHRQAHDDFIFRAGPLFSQLVLADEINRAPQKTQSALLEAMAERTVTLDGVTRHLPTPFFLIATQNPDAQRGTSRLPESQLDRFAVSLTLGYPSPESERIILAGKSPMDAIKVCVDTLALNSLQEAMVQCQQVVIAAKLLDYVVNLLVASREHPSVLHGLSTRAGRDLVAVAKALAWLRGRDFLIPEDIQNVFPCVAAHRLELSSGYQGSRKLALQILESVAVPR